MTRRRFTEREVLECLVKQGAVIPCKRCRVAFTPETARTAEREHLIEVGLDGPDTVENCAYSHHDCHAVQTNGTPATSAGSSKHRIAKTRPDRAEKFRVVKAPLDADAVGVSTDRCRRCGEYADGCICPPASAKRPAFARRSS